MLPLNLWVRIKISKVSQFEEALASFTTVLQYRYITNSLLDGVLRCDNMRQLLSEYASGVMLDVSSKIYWHLSQRGNKNNYCGFDLERFSTECRKTKVITQPIRRKEISYESQSEFKVKTTKLPKARENAGDQVAAGFSFACDWLREWREYSGPMRAK